MNWMSERMAVMTGAKSSVSFLPKNECFEMSCKVTKRLLVRLASQSAVSVHRPRLAPRPQGIQVPRGERSDTCFPGKCSAACVRPVVAAGAHQHPPTKWSRRGLSPVCKALTHSCLDPLHSASKRGCLSRNKTALSNPKVSLWRWR